MTTVHPSSVSRAKDREQTYADFVQDLRTAAEQLA
jgi:hypothetical protein